MELDCPRDGDGLAVLQLRKWGPSEFKYNPSDFREGFISPTRRLLLLLSYNFDALLLPLVKDLGNNSLESSFPSISASRENITSFSLPVESDSVTECTSEATFSGSGDAFIHGVDSAAWGQCMGEDDQHEEAPFQELLFVSGKHGLVVHAFLEVNKSSNRVIQSAQESIDGEGAAIEWGPSPTSSLNFEDQEQSDFHPESSVEKLNTFNETSMEDEIPEDGLSSCITPKKIWLHTPLLQVETVISGNAICTRFPKRPLFTKNAIVSFRLFDQGSRLLEFLLHYNHTSRVQENQIMSAMDSKINKLDLDPSSPGSTIDEECVANGGSLGMKCWYRCLKVFSGNSHRLVGFVLSVRDPKPVTAGYVDNGNSQQVIIAVARLFSWGMQWLYSTNLAEDPVGGSPFDWTDFNFSLSFLICLNKTGFISLYDATTGAYVASIDVVNFKGPGNYPHSPKQKDKGNVLSQVLGNLSSDMDGLSGKRRFERLLVFPQSSLVGVMDECGVTYFVLTNGLVPLDHRAIENVLPYQHHSGLGFFTAWEVGAAEIGYRRELNSISASQGVRGLPIHGRSSFLGNFRNNNHLQSKESSLRYRTSQYDSDISNSSCTQVTKQKRLLGSEFPFSLMRKALLPPPGSKKDDVVCCSPYGVTRLTKRFHSDEKWCQIVHATLRIDFCMDDEIINNVQDRDVSTDEAVGCSFSGFLYLVTKQGLSVVLPSISVPENSYPVETIGYRIPANYNGVNFEIGDLSTTAGIKKHCLPWQVEILDRVLLYEGSEVAEQLCLQNGWDFRISRIRRLQLALDYLKFDEIENSLEMLMGVNLAEEGILRLLFTCVYLMLCKVSNDNDVSAASRLLALATNFATRVIRRYGLLQYKKECGKEWDDRVNKDVSLPLELTDKKHDEEGNSRSLYEMAQFLVVVRSLQEQLNARFKRPDQLSDNAGLPNLGGMDLSDDEPKVPVVQSDSLLLDISERLETASSEPTAEHLALLPAYAISAQNLSHIQDFEGADIVAEGSAFEKRIFSIENPKDMITRWELENLDLKTVVKDALISGRLPLAVLRLHLHRLNSSLPVEETNDTFNDVRTVGRAIAYDLFLKGDIALAVTTIGKLGEDVETILKQLVFGTVRRSLRVQVSAEMRRLAYLVPHELKILDIVSLIERVYPCNSFFSTLDTRRKQLKRADDKDALGEIGLKVLHPMHKNLVIVCGEIDGVVLGSWANVDEHSLSSEADEDSNHSSYWTAAAAWSDAWDQRIVDRVLLDQPLLMGINVLWESQLEYHLSHNDWSEVSKLLEVIPPYALCSGSLSICLDDTHSNSPLESVEEPRVCNDYANFLELDSVYLNVPSIKLFKISANTVCSAWFRMLMEQQLAKKYIFLTDYWHSTAYIVPLLARSGFMTDLHEDFLLDTAADSSSELLVIGDLSFNPDAVQELHKVVIRFCAQFNLMNLLDIYLDVHKLTTDHISLAFVLDAVGDNEWAKCLVLLRVKGQEYDASFSNARAVASHNLVPGNKLTSLETDDIIQAVDDIAEGAGELAALATLMFAPVPVQECLSSGSVNRHCGSAQCTLENLRPALQRFPTLWNNLVGACFGEDPVSSNLVLTKVSGYSNLLDYLNWRERLFLSSARDTSILQMIPYWFPKSVKRLVQLHVQGPIGWQTLADSETGELSVLSDFYYVVNSSGHAQISVMSWEAAIQKHIEEELYATSMEGASVGFEHHLHRGRALAAFEHLISGRAHKLKSENRHLEHTGTQTSRQRNVQSDVQTLLAPTTESEGPLLSSVIPLAIEHFEDSILVASCSFLLELCGLSTNILRIDIAALRRISSFYKSVGDNHYRQLSPRGSVFYPTPVEVDITESLARTLADDYLHEYSAGVRQAGDGGTHRQLSRALLLVLLHLERASLPFSSNGMTCGSWLSCGKGDGAHLRSQQKASSQHWQLVTLFCQMHNIPLSTKYLALLARDNDWVGFLSEAQAGKYPFETVIQVASKEFNDPHLKIHILTVLKSMQSKKKYGSSNLDPVETRAGTFLSDENLYIPFELFGIIAECEKQENPGEILLLKAKNLCWSILAMVASCFPDVSPLSCLTVWLEITAARETSAIKVNDIASHIAKNVGAAVEATNALPASARAVVFHYNRKNAKRRRLLVPSEASQVSKVSGVPKIQNVIFEEETGKLGDRYSNFSNDSDSVAVNLSRMVSVLCEQHLFLPLLQAFEIFLPSCSLLPFVRALQAFSQMRLSEAEAHLESFASRIKEECPCIQSNGERDTKSGNSWIISTAVKAADAILSTCPSPYEKKCLLRLLADTDFGDGGFMATRYARLSWEIDIAEPSLRSDECPLLGKETLDDASLLKALEKNGYWEQARSWAKQLESSGEIRWRNAANHVTEMQAEAMVAEWKEFLWDVPEERAALWGHCQTLFIRYSYPAMQAGLFFLKHAEAAEKDVPARELHEILLLSLQWLSGMITMSNPFYPLHLLREIETRVWLLAVESEAQVKREGEYISTYSTRESGAGLIDHTANIIAKMDTHITAMRSKSLEKSDRENNQAHVRITQTLEASISVSAAGSTRTKRRAKGFAPSKKPLFDPVDESQMLDENLKIDASLSKWEERVEPAELERAVLSLLDFGQITAARQLQNKLSPDNTPSEFLLVDVALRLATHATPCSVLSISMLDHETRAVLQSCNLMDGRNVMDPLRGLENLSTILMEGSGRGLCRRIISVVKAANMLGLTFPEAFEKQPIELLQLLSLKAQDSFEEAKLLVQTHSMPAASIAQILAESFLKGLLAAHRGGYMDSQKEEGPAPLLWRFSDFLNWAELCPSDSEIGHALMRLVITGQEIPHACEVELLILSHHFYKLSACLDGVDVLVALAATRVEAYVLEGDFLCLARLITGVGNFHALNFILGILIANGKLDLLLQKYSAAADANSGTAEAVRGFRIAVLTSLKQFSPNNLDAFAMVYNHFDMKHETASLLELRAKQSSLQWFLRYDKDQNEDLLESMRYFIEAAEVHSSIDAGNKTRKACAQASLVSLQIRMPDTKWLDLSETNARRILVEQSRFQEALIVAEAYALNQPSEWALVLWEQMLNPELTEQFVAEFVAVLPLQPSMLVELARFYRSEMQARKDQSQFSVWLTGGGLPADWAKYLGRSFRCLLRRTRDFRLKLHLANTATGFHDIIDACNRVLDKVPENAGPLILRKGHGGGYLPLM